MTPPLADKAQRFAMVTMQPALGGQQLRATFRSTWEGVMAEEQPGNCPEACFQRSLQLAPRPRVVGWKATWAACWEPSWSAGWEAGELEVRGEVCWEPGEVEGEVRGKVPVRQETMHPLHPPPRVVVHGRVGECCYTYLVGIWQCTGRMRKGGHASRYHRAMPTQRRPWGGERRLWV